MKTASLIDLFDEYLFDRSDVLGQLFPVIGRDWSHEGVATLFSKCKKNNYKIIYLTARAIGQADPTRDYLFGLRQEQAAQLPGGRFLATERIKLGQIGFSWDRSD